MSPKLNAQMIVDTVENTPDAATDTTAADLPSGDDLLTVQEIADMIGVHTDVVRRHMRGERQPVLPCENTISGRNVVKLARRADVVKWIAARAEKPRTGGAAHADFVIRQDNRKYKTNNSKK